MTVVIHRQSLFAAAALALLGCAPAAQTQDADSSAALDAIVTDQRAPEDVAVARDAMTSSDSALDSEAADVSQRDAAEPEAGATRPVIVAVGANHWRGVSIDEGRTFCSTGRATEPDATGFDNPYLLRNVAFANGRFVSGSWRAIWVSQNGVDWTDVTGAMNPAFGQWIAGIEHGNGWWVVTGGYGTAMRSRDLSTWENTSDSLPGNEASRSLAFGQGVFVTSRDNVGWWQSADGTSWTQRDAARRAQVLFDGADFVDRPAYDRGRGIRLRAGSMGQIQRAEDRDPAMWSTVSTAPESVTHFAFGFAPSADFAPSRLPAALRMCLGL
jgi:hypothetical protein